MSAPTGVWFTAVRCSHAMDFTTASVKAAAGYALRWGGQVLRFTVDQHGHRITDPPRDPREAAELWAREPEVRP